MITESFTKYKIYPTLLTDNSVQKKGNHKQQFCTTFFTLINKQVATMIKGSTD